MKCAISQKLEMYYEKKDWGGGERKSSIGQAVELITSQVKAALFLCAE